MTMVTRGKAECLLRPADVTPSVAGFEIVGVFNPGVVEVDGKIHMLVRVAEAPMERRPGFVALPRSDLKGGYEVEWVKENDVEMPNARAVIFKRNGMHRLTSVSHLRLATSLDGIKFDRVDDVPALKPEEEYEEYGIEDARLTKIGDLYFVTYVSVSRHGIATALASTKDFRTFKRRGIIFPTENKDVVLFPEKIRDNYVALHRPYGFTPLGRPEIWLATSPDLVNWGSHRVVLGPGECSDFIRVGAGIAPLRVDDGWLEIYHAVQKSPTRKGGDIYYGLGMVLDLERPFKTVYGACAPLLRPERDSEQSGFMSDVVFPTGGVVRGDNLFLYYGAGDTTTAVTVFSLEDVLRHLKKGGNPAVSAGCN